MSRSMAYPRKRGPSLYNLSGEGTKMAGHQADAFAPSYTRTPAKKNFNVSPRDLRLADPSVGHLPLHRVRSVVWYCVMCEAEVDGPALFCREHLAGVQLRP